jgi:hypothetical protein
VLLKVVHSSIFEFITTFYERVIPPHKWVYSNKEITGYYTIKSRFCPHSINVCSECLKKIVQLNLMLLYLKKLLPENISLHTVSSEISGIECFK